MVNNSLTIRVFVNSWIDDEDATLSQHWFGAYLHARANGSAQEHFIPWRSDFSWHCLALGGCGHHCCGIPAMTVTYIIHEEHGVTNGRNL